MSIVCSVPCSVLHLLHQPGRAAGEQTGAGGVRAHRVAGDGSIGGQLLRAGLKGQAGAAGRSPSTGHSETTHGMRRGPSPKEFIVDNHLHNYNFKHTFLKYTLNSFFLSFFILIPELCLQASHQAADTVQPQQHLPRRYGSLGVA